MAIFLFHATKPIGMLEEEEHPGQTALDEEKYWHIFQQFQIQILTTVTV